MKRSKFNLSSYRLMSGDVGVMDAIDCQEILPGDSIRHAVTALIRVSPLVAPVMHPVEVQVYSFFVPNRLVWDQWETFIVNPDSGLTVPQVEVISGGANTDCANVARTLGMGSLRGTAGAVPSSRSINALPMRARNLIWNEFFRDQDIDTPLTVSVGNGPDSHTLYTTQYGRWKKDYFTTARASPQMGAAGSVSVDITGMAFVKGLGKGNATFPSSGTTIRESDGTTPVYATGALVDPSGANTQFQVEQRGVTGFPNIRAEMDSAGSTVAGNFTIEQWRQAMAAQKMREARSQFGSRYIDYLRYYGVNPSDARLQRPEYLGGGSQIVSFSEVLSTADSGTAEVGSMAGHGIAAMRTRPYRKFFEEHGHVITFICCRPAGVYGNGTPRNFYRAAWGDYFQKEMEILGDQAVLKKELNAAEASGTSNTVFGYVPRHEEYRRGFSSIVGNFENELSTWHYGRLWEAATGPVLNSTFLSCIPTERVYADQVTNNLRMMIHHSKSARRLVSKFSRNP